MPLMPSGDFPFTDCRPLEDISGGSAAKTCLVEDFSGSTFVRKWGAGAAADRLELQARWIGAHGSEFPCPQILDQQRLSTGIFYYDMGYLSRSKTLAHSLLTDNTEEQLDFLFPLLERLYKKSHHERQAPQPEQRRRYLQEKFHHNLDLLFFRNPAVARLSRVRRPVIQGVPLKNLAELLECPVIRETMNHLEQEDLSAFGHGDLTLSNLLLSRDSIYLIDPNPNFGLISPAQEFSKILQSTLVAYEHLNQITDIRVADGEVDYRRFTSRRLDNITDRLLETAPPGSQNRNLVLLHLCIHLCRLLPYLPAAQPGKSLIYYSEILKLLNRLSARG